MKNPNSDVDKFGLKELIAIGVGGMIGGGIFSVLGLAVDISGHAAPLAFAVGSLIALAAGYSYVKLALAYHNDGASFTYLERAFPRQPNIAGIAGWTVIIGYVGTLALYAFTFGAYGAELFGEANSEIVRVFLSLSVLLFFMLVNLYGVKASGKTEDIIVYTKIILLAIFAGIGLFYIKPGYLTPFVNKGTSSIFLGGALIFVAYEGFQLITNAVCETSQPQKNIPRGIYGSIAITSIIYVVVALVAVGNLSLQAFHTAQEYALAAAAEPILGNAGRYLIALAALLATSSAINGTVFGASRMMAEMATEKKMPESFSFRNRTQVPWVAILILTLLAAVFTMMNGLEMIAAFSSMTFLLVSITVSVANFKLHNITKSRIVFILPGLVLMLVTVILLIMYLAENSSQTLIWIGSFYLAVIIVELLFSKRRILLQKFIKSK